MSFPVKQLAILSITVVIFTSVIALLNPTINTPAATAEPSSEWAVDTAVQLAGSGLFVKEIKLRIDSDENRHLVLLQPAWSIADRPYYWTGSESGWQITGLPFYEDETLGEFELDKAGNFHVIVFYDPNLPIGPHYVYASYLSETGVAKQYCVGSPDACWGEYDIVVDPVETVHVIGSTFYSQFDAVEELHHEVLPFVTTEVSATVDRQYNFHIAFVNQEGSVAYAVRDSTGWHTPQIIAATGKNPSIATDSNDVPFVCYEIDNDDEDFLIDYRNQAGEWITSFTHNLSHDCSVAQVGYRLHVVYETNGYIKYGHFDGDSWRFDQGLSDVIGATVLQRPALAFDKYGVPQIALYRAEDKTILIASKVVDFSEMSYLPILAQQ
jgi:hypothetical protein